MTENQQLKVGKALDQFTGKRNAGADSALPRKPPMMTSPATLRS